MHVTMSRPAQLRHIWTVKGAAKCTKLRRHTWGSQMKEGGVELPAVSQACSSATSAERPARSSPHDWALHGSQDGTSACVNRSPERLNFANPWKSRIAEDQAASIQKFSAVRVGAGSTHHQPIKLNMLRGKP